MFAELIPWDCRTEVPIFLLVVSKVFCQFLFGTLFLGLRTLLLSSELRKVSSYWHTYTIDCPILCSSIPSSPKASHFCSITVCRRQCKNIVSLLRPNVPMLLLYQHKPRERHEGQGKDTKAHISASVSWNLNVPGTHPGQGSIPIPFCPCLWQFNAS